MKKIGNRNFILILELVVVAALLIVIFAFNKNKPATNNSLLTSGLPASTALTTTASVPVDESLVRAPVPVGLVVPEKDTKLTATQQKETALPAVVEPAAPGVDAKFRSFNVAISNCLFSPFKIIGRVKDTMHIVFAAVDKDYDINFPSYNMAATIKKGETKIMEFYAGQTGDFTYYSQVCGGLSGTAKGDIIISDK